MILSLNFSFKIQNKRIRKFKPHISSGTATYYIAKPTEIYTNAMTVLAIAIYSIVRKS